jgi:hypothetical protein
LGRRLIVLVTALDLHFADGEYLFDLKLPQLAELQEKRGPIFAVYGRVLKGRHLIGEVAIADTTAGEAFAEDLFDTIRLGLIGGGGGVVDGQKIEVDAITAKKLVERYCHAAPLKQSWAVAAAILAAKIEGYEPKKKEPVSEAVAAPAKPRRKSTSKRSVETA